MLEIIIIGLIFAAVAIFFLRRAGKKPSSSEKPAVYVCDRCGNTDCHCERRT